MKKIIITIKRIRTKISDFFSRGIFILFTLIFLPIVFYASSGDQSKNNQLNPDRYQAVDFFQLMLAEIAINRQYWPEAVTIYLKLAEQLDDESVKSNAMELSFALGLKDEVKPLILDWHAKDPDNVVAQIYLVKLHLFERKYSEAEAVLYQIKAEDKHQHEVIFLKGLLAYDLTLHDKAINYFKMLLDTPIYQDNAALFIAKTYTKKGMVDEAIIYYGHIQSGVLYYNAQLSLIMLHVQDKNPQYALTLVTEILPYVDTKHYRKRFIYIKGTLELLLSKNALAIMTFHQGVREFPDDVNFYYLRGLSHISLGNTEKAQRDLKVVIDQQPNHHDALSALGYVLAEHTERYDESYQLLKKAHKLAPNAPQVLDSLGWLMYKKGNHQEALIYLKEAYELFPYGKIALHYKGVLEANGQNEKAQTVIKKIENDKASGYDIQQLIQHYRGTWND